MNIDNFHYMVGKLMMYCQCIENDVKWIYCIRLGGDATANYKQIEREPLGPVLLLLQELDDKQRTPLFSRSDYKLLNSIRFVRNYWAHEGYTAFVYERKEQMQQAFDKTFNQLKSELYDLERLSSVIEDTRIKCFDKYNKY